MSKIILITGATSGIGRTTALHLAKLGHHVIATGRRSAELATLKVEASGGTLDTITLDVTSPDSIAACAAAVDQLTGGHGLDVLVNNAGFGMLGPTSEISDADTRRQFETNVFGLMNVTRAFLPKMIARHAGRIINITSVGGRITLPYFGVYNSTKYAVEAMSDALRYELRPLGVDVTIIEPGVIRTEFEATAVSGLAQFSTSPFADAVSKYESISKLANKFASNPIVIAKAVARAIRVGRPRARYVAPASNLALIALSRVLPQRLWDWAMRTATYLTPKYVRATTAAPGATTATTASRGAIAVEIPPVVRDAKPAAVLH